MPPRNDELLTQSAVQELLEDILPFWRRHAVDERSGGFVGEMSNDLRVNEDAPRGLILNARILWTFSAAYAYTQDNRDRTLAQRAYAYLANHFLDKEHGGFFWELNPDGTVLGDKKIYGQAFCLYALAEYCRVFRDTEALERALQMFNLMEAHAHDDRYGGYLEVLSRDWQPCTDMRLSDKDMNVAKSMNNHLHILEAYTNLLRVLPRRGRPGLASRGRRALVSDGEEQGQDAHATRLRELLDLFRRRILNAEQTHLQHFFDESWTPKSDSYTFGHDIEGSWLLCEAAEVLGDHRLREEVRGIAIKIARAVLAEGLDTDGGLFYEARNGRIINPDKEWWPQAEAVVGFYNAWQLTGDNAFRKAAIRCWRFIQEHVVDREHGEWFWCIRPDGTPDPAQPKVSQWKCPYHNSRCCLEIIRRTGKA